MDTTETELTAPPPLTDEGLGVPSRWATIPEWSILGLITLVSGFIRFWRLSVPHSIIPLDETYYAKDAVAYLKHGVEGGFAVHPPVGKWLIAGGIQIFGNRPFGWRFSAAVVGTLAIVIMYFIAKRLWGTRFAAVSASILLAADGLFFVQSRIAMLDIFLAFFILLGFWLLLEDRARTALDHRGIRWWRIASGVSFGLAGATKWSAATSIAVVALLALIWEAARLRRRRDLAHAEALAAVPVSEEPEIAILGVEPPPAPPTRPPYPLGELIRQTVKVGATFVLIPLLVYIGSYTPWAFSTKKYVAPRCNDVTGSVTKPKTGVSLWLCYQREVKDYHLNLKSVKDDGSPVHPYMSRAWSWPWIGRPAAHYFEADHRGAVTYDSEIVGLPNPIVWWPAFMLGIPLLLWWAIRRDAIAAVILFMFAPLYLPWLATTRPLFMFYMTPAVPFLVLAITHVLHRTISRWPAAVPIATAYVALAVFGFAYFYPVLAAYPIPEGGAFGWRAHMWFKGDCTSKGVKLWCWI